MNSEGESTGRAGPNGVSPEHHHLHPVAMLIGAIKTVRRWVGAFVIPGIAFLASQGFGTRTVALVLIGFVVVAVFAAVWGFLSWRATTYGVSGGAFHLKQGVLQKNERTIPLDHVQSVDTVQGVIQRLFGVVEVRVETAGGGGEGPDASLPALDLEAAEALRREIEGSRREVVEEATGPTVIRRLSTRELLIAGATSGQIGVALSLIAVASQVLDDFFSDSFVERIVTSFAPRSITTVLILVLLIGLFAWLLAIGGTVLAYAGFTLSRDGDFLYIRRGLLEKREATIPLARIQAVKVVEGVLRQPFGLAMLRVESAGYGEDAGVSTTLFPLLSRDRMRSLLREAAPEFAVEADLEPLPRRALRRYVLRAVLSALPLAVVVSAIGFGAVFVPAFGSAGALPLFEFGITVGGVLALVLLAVAGLYGRLRYGDAGWALAGGCLITRSRTLARTTAVAPRRRLQSRSVVRSPFQRRARLATLRVRVASGGGGTEFEVVDLESATAGTLIERLGPRSVRKPA